MPKHHSKPAQEAQENSKKQGTFGSLDYLRISRLFCRLPRARHYSSTLIWKNSCNRKYRHGHLHVDDYGKTDLLLIQSRRVDKSLKRAPSVAEDYTLKWLTSHTMWHRHGVVFALFKECMPDLIKEKAYPRASGSTNCGDSGGWMA